MKKNNIFSPFAIVMIAIIVACTLIDTFMGSKGPMTTINYVAMAAAILGVVNCVLSSDASIWCYIFGVPAVLCQGIVALHDGNIGIGWMDIGFLIPMQIVGFFIWMRNGAALSTDGKEAQVEGKRLTWPQRGLVCMFIGIALLGLAPILDYFHTNSPYLDAAAVIMQIVAQIMMTFALMEQWVVWIIVNLVYVCLWVHTYIIEGAASNAPIMIAMWLCYLIISIYGLRTWYKLSR